MFAKVDDIDYALVKNSSWNIAESTSGIFYAVAYVNKKSILMHRLIMKVPSSLHTDHINGDGLDNRRSNLRVCNRTQNMQNKRIYKNNQSGYKGISKEGNRWRANITVDKQRVFIASFLTKEEAAMAYNNAALTFFGDFARLN
jgi:hypothetical protein